MTLMKLRLLSPFFLLLLPFSVPSLSRTAFFQSSFFNEIQLICLFESYCRTHWTSLTLKKSQNSLLLTQNSLSEVASPFVARVCARVCIYLHFIYYMISFMKNNVHLHSVTSITCHLSLFASHRTGTVTLSNEPISMQGQHCDLLC